jgi:hypothetical protein
MDSCSLPAQVFGSMKLHIGRAICCVEVDDTPFLFPTWFEVREEVLRGPFQWIRGPRHTWWRPRTST